MATSDGHGLQIPVIDISHADEATGDEMVNAAARYGFLYIRANEIDFSPPIVERMFALVYIYIYIYNIMLFTRLWNTRTDCACRHADSSSRRSKRKPRSPFLRMFVAHPCILVRFETYARVAIGKQGLEFDALGDFGPGASEGMSYPSAKRNVN